MCIDNTKYEGEGEKLGGGVEGLGLAALAFYFYSYRSCVTKVVVRGQQQQQSVWAFEAAAARSRPWPILWRDFIIIVMRLNLFFQFKDISVEMNNVHNKT